MIQNYRKQLHEMGARITNEIMAPVIDDFNMQIEAVQAQLDRIEEKLDALIEDK